MFVFKRQPFKAAFLQLDTGYGVIMFKLNKLSKDYSHTTLLQHSSEQRLYQEIVVFKLLP